MWYLVERSCLIFRVIASNMFLERVYIDCTFLIMILMSLTKLTKASLHICVRDAENVLIGINLDTKYILFYIFLFDNSITCTW